VDRSRDRPASLFPAEGGHPAGKENFTDFKQAKAGLLPGNISLGGLQYSGNQAGPHHRLLLGNRIEQGHMITERVIFAQLNPIAGLGTDETVIDRLGESESAENVPDFISPDHH
jgi:hypothetical protein